MTISGPACADCTVCLKTMARREISVKLDDYFIEYIRKHRNVLGPEHPDNYVGVWTDENRQFKTDISTNMQDRTEAVTHGERNRQSAIFDLEARKPLDLPGHEHT